MKFLIVLFPGRGLHMQWYNNIGDSKYNYCPCVRVIWRFVYPRLVILLEGEGTVLPVEGEQIVILPSHFYYTEFLFWEGNITCQGNITYQGNITCEGNSAG